MGKFLTEITAKTSLTEYPVIIGSGITAEVLGRPGLFSGDPSAFIISSKVYSLHTNYINDIIKKIPGAELFLFEDSEANKSFLAAGPFLNQMARAGMNRKSTLVAVGGGVTGDFGGFLASVYMRGIKLIHVPTTLLAMVDSSMGGKTAVNIEVGKNMTGTFHQPDMVVSDISFLETLPSHELANGLTESLKHALIGDKLSLEILIRNDSDTIRNESEITELISASARFKTGIVQNDEHEGGLRAILNFGHTVGHAIESLMNYTGISHGSAVAAGMAVKTLAASHMGLLTDEDRDLILILIKKYSLAAQGLKLDASAVYEHMKYDKKNSFGKVNLVTLNGIGKPVINSAIDPVLMVDSVRKILAGEF